MFCTPDRNVKPVDLRRDRRKTRTTSEEGRLVRRPPRREPEATTRKEQRMSRIDRAGAASLLAAPVVVAAGVLTDTTISDDAGKQVAALASHRDAMIGGAALQTIALVLLAAGLVWLAVTLAPRARNLAVSGGILGLVGSLVILFEDGVHAAVPSVVAALDPSQATSVVDRIQSSAVVSTIEPMSLLQAIGIALLAVAAVKAGIPRWAAVLFGAGGFVNTVGFAVASKPVVLAGFVLLVVGLAPVATRLAGGGPSFDSGRLDPQTVR
jgi:hypothetical protein